MASLPSLDDLASLATGRSDSLFRADIESHAEQLNAAVNGAIVLVIGAGGTIGSSTSSHCCPTPLQSLSPSI